MDKDGGLSERERQDAEKAAYNRARQERLGVRTASAEETTESEPESEQKSESESKTKSQPRARSRTKTTKK